MVQCLNVQMFTVKCLKTWYTGLTTYIMYMTKYKSERKMSLWHLKCVTWFNLCKNRCSFKHITHCIIHLLLTLRPWLATSVQIFVASLFCYHILLLSVVGSAFFQSVSATVWECSLQALKPMDAHDLSASWRCVLETVYM